MNRFVGALLAWSVLSGCCGQYDIDYCMRARAAAASDAHFDATFCNPPYSTDDAWQERDPLRPGTWDECYDEVYMIVYDEHYARACTDDTGNADTGG